VATKATAPASSTQSATTRAATPPVATSAATTPTATHSTTAPTTHPQGSVPLSVASYSGATLYACGDAPAQGTTTTAATFTLYNDSSATVEIAGQPVQAGGSWSPGGAIGAVWMVANASGACLDVFKQTGTGQVIVT
jgi:hypothetical protein